PAYDAEVGALGADVEGAVPVAQGRALAGIRRARGLRVQLPRAGDELLRVPRAAFQLEKPQPQAAQQDRGTNCGEEYGFVRFLRPDPGLLRRRGRNFDELACRLVRGLFRRGIPGRNGLDEAAVRAPDALSRQFLFDAEETP